MQQFEGAWHTVSRQDVAVQLGLDLRSGLSTAEARERLRRFGPNRLTKEERASIVEVFLEEIREPMILLLLITGVLYAIGGGVVDALTIFTVILILVGVEVFTEYRAEGALAALRKLAEPTATVRRDGHPLDVPTEAIVPGDLILLDAGRRVPADARLVEAYGLAVDESALTGESVPVEKDAAVTLPESIPLAERRNLVFAGSAVTRGRGSAVVATTGMGTELGRIAGLARAITEPRTPLQETMRELTRWMVWLALGFSVVVPVLGWLLAKQSPRQMLLTGLSLAFATIPEELPIIITVVLALGGYRLARRNAILKRLRAAETLGAVTVIATDKTGTLTENRMEVRRLDPDDGRQKLLEIGTLGNDATISDHGFTGDPLDTALLRAADTAGLDAEALRWAHPVRDEFTFDTTRRRMSVLRARNGGLWVVAKGAPEAVLAVSSYRWSRDGEHPLSQAERDSILATAAQMASEGLRVIALAEKEVPASPLSQDAAESGLTFVGLVGLADPPRSEVPEAIRSCRAAGIRPLMITGDHPLTARAVAKEVGLNGAAHLLTGTDLDALSDDALHDVVGEVSLYARTTPEHKLRIVRALRARGERVAVTGDGVNDAPALAAADIGVAMGETGTDVAREAADVVLADDNFATIVHAVEEGRVLFANLRKGVRYYLAVKVALISATLLPVLLAVPVPFAPIQIILMELFMDLAASAGFVTEPAEPGLMQRPPRDPRARFMDRAMVLNIVGAAVGLFAAVSVAYLVTWYGGASVVQAQTTAFVTWLLGHVALAFNVRSERIPLLRQGLLSNRLMVGWAAATLAVVLFATQVPAGQTALKTASLSGGQWELAVATALVGTFWLEVRKWLVAWFGHADATVRDGTWNQ